ncbi:MAG: type II toxin-antitoxin system MqsR family toxin [Clostridia bacterium]|jgi:hypothetical protein
MPTNKPYYNFDDFKLSLQDANNIIFTDYAEDGKDEKIGITKLGFSANDVLNILRSLKLSNFYEIKPPVTSKGERDYADVYKISRSKIRLYIKITMQGKKIIIISFHKDIF